MPDFGIMRGFNDKLFGDKLVAGQLPTQLGKIGSENFSQFLLDLYPSAAAAYSVRKLRNAYSGSAIRVRRSSDNTEQNIGFTALGNLDTTALTSFCSGTNGFVTTWYDQSGNGANSTQTTAANQPQIVSSGSVININGKPSIQFDGSTSNFSNAFSSSAGANVSAFAVRSFSSYPSTYRTMFNFNTYGLTHNSTGGPTQYGVAHIFNNSTTVLSNNYPTTTGQALDTTINQTVLERNNFSSTLSAGIGYSAGGGSVGSFQGTVQPFLGNLQELVIYQSDKNADKTGIQTNINTYYAIY
jgi:hypothetical protein